MGLLDALRGPPKPKLPIGDAPLNFYCSIAEPPPIRFPTTACNQRDLSAAELLPHLRGLQGWIFSQVQRAPTRAQAHAIEHVWKTQRQVSLLTSPAHADAVVAWAREANALVFLADGTLRNPDGEILVGPGAEPTAEPPYPAEARARRERVRAKLEAMGLRTPEMKPVVGESEVRLRDPAEVRARALGLATVAVRGESVASGGPIPAADLRARMPDGIRTEREEAFLDADAPDESEVVQLIWRYEGLWTLLWALGRVELGPPRPCQAADAMQAAFRLVEERPDALRPTGEILDALDEHYRLHWCVRDRQLKGGEVPGVHPGVVQERRVALGWLVRTGEFDWEEIPTPT